jgi:glutamyl-Q tRNA(Asp) synthetase
MPDPLPYRGRFAPSPTGPLHFGSLVAALGSYCDARHSGGQWLVRIEDVDRPRARPQYESSILRTLEGYGFAWDGPVIRQSERTELYRCALDQLASQGDLFPCTCSRRELATLPLGPGGEPIYPGTCRSRSTSEIARLPRYAWRLRVQGVPEIAFVDRLQGLQGQVLATEVGDFVVQRSDGLFAYQLAVVVDDAQQGITDVVRGADLLSCTARQVHLQRRLGVGTPRYLHLPVAANAAGEKLSKQTHAAPLPAQPLMALCDAWRFIDQPEPPELPASLADFWGWAIRHWEPVRLPAVQMRAAPVTAEPGASGAL